MLWAGPAALSNRPAALRSLTFHTRVVPSRPQVNSRLPSLEKLDPSRTDPSPVRTALTCPEAALISWTDPSAKTPAISAPSGDTATDVASGGRSIRCSMGWPSGDCTLTTSPSRFTATITRPARSIAALVRSVVASRQSSVPPVGSKVVAIAGVLRVRPRLPSAEMTAKNGCPNALAGMTTVGTAFAGSTTICCSGTAGTSAPLCMDKAPASGTAAASAVPGLQAAFALSSAKATRTGQF